MRNSRNTSASPATKPSNPSAPEKRTMMQFMLTNPFKTRNVDWLTVLMIAMLAGGAIMFILAMKLLASSVT